MSSFIAPWSHLMLLMLFYACAGLPPTIDRQNSNDITTSAVLVRESSRSTLSSGSSASRNSSAGDLLELASDPVLIAFNGAAPHDTDTGQG